MNVNIIIELDVIFFLSTRTYTLNAGMQIHERKEETIFVLICM